MEPTAVSSEARQDARDRRLLLVTVVAGHAIKHLFNAGFFILLPELKVGLGLTNTGVGALSTVRSIVGGLTNLPAGFAADWLRHRWVVMLSLSLILLGLFYLLLGLSQGFLLAVLSAAMATSAITLYHPPAIAALSRRFADRRGLAISLHGTGGSIGEAAGPLVAGALLAVMSWRLIFQASAAPAVLAGVALWLVLRRIPDTPTTKTSFTSYLSVYRGALARLLSDRRLLGILLVVAGFSATQSAVMTFLPIYLREDVGYSTVRAGLYLSVGQMIGIVSQPIMGLLSDRYSRKKVLLPGFLCLGLTIFIVSIAPPDLPLLAAVAAMGAFTFPLMAVLLAAAGDVAGEELQATTVSLVFASSVLFSGFSPTISGLLADEYGVKLVFIFAAGMATATTLFLATQRWPGRHAFPPSGSREGASAPSQET